MAARCFVCANPLNQRYYMLECLDCGIWHSIFPYDPMWYGEKYADEYQRRASSDLGKQIAYHRKEKIQWELQYHLPGKQNISVLDVGCGPSSVLLGIPNAQIREYDPLFNKRHNDFLPADITVFFDSFEHFENPFKVVRLTDSQLIYITIPIVPADIIQGLRPINRWKHYKPREHLILFSKEGLINYMETCGYECYATDDGESDFGREDILSFTFLRKV